MNRLIPTDTLDQVLAMPDSKLPARAYLLTLKSTGRKWMERELHKLAHIASGGKLDAYLFPWWLLRYEHTAILRTELIELGLAPATINHTLSGLRGVLRQCWLLGLMSIEEYQRAAEVGPVHGSVVPAGREVPAGEVRALVDACQADTRPQGVRDGALLGVAFTAGLRVSEIAALDLADYLPDRSELLVRHGKGNKQRRTYLAAGAKRALEDWLEIRGDQPGPLFQTVSQIGTITGRRLVANAIAQRFGYRAKQAGVAHFSPHDCRRTWIGNLLQSDTDLSTAQRLAGHANPTTTARYDRRPEEVKKQAVERLHFPWASGANATNQGIAA